MSKPTRQASAIQTFIESDVEDTRRIHVDIEKSLRNVLIATQQEITMMRKERMEDKEQQKEHESAFKDELTQEFNMIKSTFIRKSSRKHLQIIFTLFKTYVHISCVIRV